MVGGAAGGWGRGWVGGAESLRWAGPLVGGRGRGVGGPSRGWAEPWVEPSRWWVGLAAGGWAESQAGGRSRQPLSDLERMLEPGMSPVQLAQDTVTAKWHLEKAPYPWSSSRAPKIRVLLRVRGRST